MRRIALILLIALLPFQSIWAAAANACQQECSSAGKHFGHHAHEHANAAGDSAPDGAGDSSLSDSSTSHGHGHGIAEVPLEDHPLVRASRPGYLPIPYRRSYADRFLESPLRPPLQYRD